MEMSEQKDKLFSLVRGGSVGEDVWNHFLHVETSLEKEIEELMREADSLKPGWYAITIPQIYMLVFAFFLACTSYGETYSVPHGLISIKTSTYLIAYTCLYILYCL
jgi:hypothetical protein